MSQIGRGVCSPTTVTLDGVLVLASGKLTECSYRIAVPAFGRTHRSCQRVSAESRRSLRPKHPRTSSLRAPVFTTGVTTGFCQSAMFTADTLPDHQPAAKIDAATSRGAIFDAAEVDTTTSRRHFPSHRLAKAHPHPG